MGRNGCWSAWKKGVLAEICCDRSTSPTTNHHSSPNSQQTNTQLNKNPLLTLSNSKSPNLAKPQFSILSDLTMGMESICGPAFGAKKHTLLGLSLQRTILFLLSISLPITPFWMNMKNILVFYSQDEAIATEAQSPYVVIA